MLPQLQRWLPPGVKLAVLSDRTQTIRASVNDVQYTLLLSIALVVLVMFLFLRRFWPTFIAGVTVPLSLAGTAGVMYLCNYSLDNLSLMALTVSVGFVVDDAIVVIENIVRFIEEGDSAVGGGAQGRAADRVHGGVDQFVAGRGVHPHPVHGRVDRAAVPRIRRDVDGGHPRFRRRVADADADALRTVSQGREPRPAAGVVLRNAGAVFRRDAPRLRTRVEVGTAAPVVHAARDAGDDCGDCLAIYSRAEGVFPATGHGDDERRHGSRAGYFLCDDGRASSSRWRPSWRRTRPWRRSARSWARERVRRR